MATGSNSHSHPVKIGSKTYTTGSIGHQHTETPKPADALTAAEVAALKALLVAGGSGGGTTPDPNPPIPDPPDPPPPLTGTVINPGTGTIAAAIALGNTDLVLRGGTYKDSFGSTQRTDTVSLRNYPGELPIIDGTGLAQNFLYIGSGNWTLTGIKVQGFRPVNSGVLACNSGTLTLDACQVVGTGSVDSTSQLVYGFGTGTVTVRGSRLWNAPGAAFQLYTNGVSDPVGVVTDSQLGGLYRGAFVYDGTATFTRVTFTGTPPYDIEVQSDATANLVSCTGTGVGGAVKRLNV